MAATTTPVNVMAQFSSGGEDYYKFGTSISSVITDVTTALQESIGRNFGISEEDFKSEVNLNNCSELRKLIGAIVLAAHRKHNKEVMERSPYDYYCQNLINEKDPIKQQILSWGICNGNKFVTKGIKLAEALHDPEFFKKVAVMAFPVDKYPSLHAVAGEYPGNYSYDIIKAFADTGLYTFEESKKYAEDVRVDGCWHSGYWRFMKEKFDLEGEKVIGDADEEGEDY